MSRIAGYSGVWAGRKTSFLNMPNFPVLHGEDLHAGEKK
jgi:hypothetical protein